MSVLKASKHWSHKTSDARRILNEAVVEFSRLHRIDAPTLRAKALLHFFQYKDKIEPKEIYRKINEIAMAITFQLNNLRGIIWVEQADKVDLQSSFVDEIHSNTGSLIIKGLHYLKYQGDNSGTHYALFSQNNLILAYGLVVKPVRAEVISNVRKSFNNELPIMSLSRLYVVPHAPKNTVSKFLSLMCKKIQYSLPKFIISTVVDANLEFTGISYKASGWSQLTNINHLGYFYKNNAYITMRQIQNKFGFNDLNLISQQSNNSIQHVIVEHSQKLHFGRQVS